MHSSLVCSFLHERFCATPPPVVDNVSLAKYWAGQAFMVFLFLNYFLIAYQAIAFVIRRTIRKLTANRRLTFSAVRSLLTPTSLERFVGNMRDVKLAKLMRGTMGKFVGDLKEKEIGSRRQSAMLGNYFNRGTIASVARNTKTFAANWMNKTCNVKDADVLIRSEAKRSPLTKSEQAFKILLRQQNTRDTFSPTLKESTRSGLIRKLVRSKELGMSEESLRKCRILRRNVKNLNGRCSDMRRQRTRFSLKSNHGSSTDNVSESRTLKCTSRREYREDGGDQNSQMSVLLNVPSSQLTIRNEFFHEETSKSDSESSSGTPKVHIEFNVKKRLDGESKILEMGDKSCTKCGKCRSGLTGQLVQREVCSRVYYPRSAQKSGRGYRR